MLFSTVEIRPSSEGEWETWFYNQEGERENVDRGPHSRGFYHYPRHKGRRAAFEDLKSLMIANHEAEIERLMSSLEKLKALSGGEEV